MATIDKWGADGRIGYGRPRLKVTARVSGKATAGEWGARLPEQCLSSDCVGSPGSTRKHNLAVANRSAASIHQP